MSTFSATSFNQIGKKSKTYTTDGGQNKTDFSSFLYTLYHGERLFARIYSLVKSETNRRLHVWAIENHVNSQLDLSYFYVKFGVGRFCLRKYRFLNNEILNFGKFPEVLIVKSCV